MATCTFCSLAARDDGSSAPGNVGGMYDWKLTPFRTVGFLLESKVRKWLEECDIFRKCLKSHFYAFQISSVLQEFILYCVRSLDHFDYELISALYSKTQQTMNEAEYGTRRNDITNEGCYCNRRRRGYASDDSTV